jgi:hypothetical protein
MKINESECCPVCTGQQIAESVAHQEDRHPLEMILSRKPILFLPEELSVEFSQRLLRSFYERYREIVITRIVCN